MKVTRSAGLPFVFDPLSRPLIPAARFSSIRWSRRRGCVVWIVYTAAAHRIQVLAGSVTAGVDRAACRGLQGRVAALAGALLTAAGIRSSPVGFKHCKSG